MSANPQQASNFEAVKVRLAEIADAVDDEDISLDDALDLYEEAVSLGLQASDLLEVGISPAEDDANEGQPDDGAPEFADSASVGSTAPRQA